MFNKSILKAIYNSNDTKNIMKLIGELYKADNDMGAYFDYEDGEDLISKSLADKGILTVNRYKQDGDLCKFDTEATDYPFADYDGNAVQAREVKKAIKDCLNSLKSNPVRSADPFQ